MSFHDAQRDNTKRLHQTLCDARASAYEWTSAQAVHLGAQLCLKARHAKHQHVSYGKAHSILVYVNIYTWFKVWPLESNPEVWCSNLDSDDI